MAQSVRIELTCDACKADDIHNTEAETTPPVVMGKGKALVLDLCEPHRKELYDPLADLLARDGRSEDGTRRLRLGNQARREQRRQDEQRDRPSRSHQFRHLSLDYWWPLAQAYGRSPRQSRISTASRSAGTSAMLSTT